MLKSQAYTPIITLSYTHKQRRSLHGNHALMSKSMMQALTSPIDIASDMVAYRSLVCIGSKPPPCT